MYRPIGYRTKSQAAILIPAATYLLDQFGSKTETAISEAFRVFSDRRFVKSAGMHDYLQLSKDPNFEDPNGAPLRNLLHITFAMLANSGFGDYRPNVLTYDTNALMTIDEVIDEVLGAHIQLPTGDHMDGEKTGFEAFRTHVPQVIRELAILEKLRPWYLAHFRRYIGDLVFRLDMGETQASALDQFDLTLLTQYTFDNEYSRSKLDPDSGFKLEVARDTDPETAEVMGRIKSVCELGPWIRFHRMISNADRNELAYVIGPIVNQLPLVSGYRLDRGPFREQFLNTVESVTWGDQAAFKAELERLQYMDNADLRLNLTGIRVPMKRELRKGVKAQKSLTPILLDYKPSINVQVYRSGDSIEIAHEWRSAVHRRLVSTRYGASTDTMLTDMAFKMTSLGEVSHAHLNIDSFGLVDLDKSVEDRRVDISQTEKFSGKNIINEKVYFVRNGKFISDGESVDMTLFYNRLGNLMYRPAFSEYFKPTLEWFNTPDSTAVDFIIARLGLSPMDAARSKTAILISHNAEKYKRVTGADNKRLASLINLVDHCRFASGFTARNS